MVLAVHGLLRPGTAPQDSLTPTLSRRERGQQDTYAATCTKPPDWRSHSRA